MIQIQVPINRSEINKEIQLKYQTILWETQYNTFNKGELSKSVEPNVKNIQIINMQNKHIMEMLYTDSELDIWEIVILTSSSKL